MLEEWRKTEGIVLSHRSSWKEQVVNINGGENDISGLERKVTSTLGSSKIQKNGYGTQTLKNLTLVENRYRAYS